MLTAQQQEILKALHAGRRYEHDKHLQTLIESGHVEEKDGIWRLTDRGLKEARVAEGFGAAIADALMPGSGSSSQR